MNRSLAPMIMVVGLTVATLSACDTREFGDQPAELIVVIVTSGDVIDEDGYTLTVGSIVRPVDVNDQSRFDGLEPGSYTVLLDGTAANCFVSGGREREIALTPGERREVRFEVTCAAIGSNLLFESDRSGSLDLHMLDFSTGISTAFAASSGADFDGAVAPDGAWIYFTSRREGNLDVYRIRRDGTELRNLTSHASDDYEPAVSPDGSRIVFTSKRDGVPQLYIMDADGANVGRLTHDDVPDGQAVWLNSERVLFSRLGTLPQLHWVDVRSGEWDFFRVDRIGGSFPAVSPDGSMVAFAGRSEGNLDIYLISADGSGEPIQLTDHPANDAAPAFSPDGTRIAFASERSGNGDIYLMDLQGELLLNVTDHPAFDFKPVFLPND